MENKKKVDQGIDSTKDEMAKNLSGYIYYLTQKIKLCEDAASGDVDARDTLRNLSDPSIAHIKASVLGYAQKDCEPKCRCEGALSAFPKLVTETLGLKNENPPHEGVAIVDSDTPLVYDILGDFLETLDRNGYTAKIEIIRK